MDYKEISEKYIMNTYKRYPLTLVRGQGSYVYDEKGNEYLDFIAGIAVCSLGHAPALILDTLKKQAEKLIHTSNLFYTVPQIELAEFLSTKFSGNEVWKLFYCNSGAEANEAAIKLVRKFHSDANKKRYEIITFFNSFHGRTYGALSATAQEKFHKGFEPMLEGFKYLPYNDIDVLRASITENTAAIMLETIQAEGGVNVANKDFLNAISEICKQNNILLVFDEVQTGLGRTGKLFSFQHYGIEPDIFTIAKGVAGGLPMGIMMAKRSVADAFVPGNHASTFGGTPLVCAVALEVLKKITDAEFLAEIEKKGNYLISRLTELKNELPIKNVRGKGLLIGVVLDVKDASYIVTNAINQGLLINVTAGNVVRLVPPLTIDYNEIDEFIEKFKRSAK